MQKTQVNCWWAFSVENHGGRAVNVRVSVLDGCHSDDEVKASHAWLIGVWMQGSR